MDIALFLDGPIAGEMMTVDHLSQTIVVPVRPSTDPVTFADYPDEPDTRYVDYYIVLSYHGLWLGGHVGLYSIHGYDPQMILKSLRTWIVRHSSDAHIRAMTGKQVLGA